MANNSKYFYISGFISFTFFSIVLFLFGYMMFSTDKIITYAEKKENYISISLNTVNTTISKNKKENVEINKKVKKIEKVEVSEPIVNEVKEIDISNLFSDVWTKDIKKIKDKPKKKSVRKLNEIEKKIKTVKNNRVKSFTEKINNMDSFTVDNKNAKASTGNEVNEYLAKINALVYQHFTPPQNSQGHSVQAIIDLSAIGKVQDFRILNYSANESLNSECDKIKKRLMSVLFPINPQNKSYIAKVILTSKE